MGFYVLRRLTSTVAVMAMVGVFIFLLLHITPGDPAAIVAGDAATPETIAAIHAKLGLDAPLPTQFIRWSSGLLQGDFGTSIFSGQPVLSLLAQRLQPTLSLSILTVIFSVTIAIAFGVYAAWRSGGALDQLLTIFSTIGFSVPVFVIGYFLVYLFAIKLHWLPVQGYVPIQNGFLPWLIKLILPTLTLSIGYVALVARITRGTMLEVLSEDYIRTAVAKGAPTTAVLLKHALKNAGVPILTVVGVGIAGLIGGVVITETVFDIPGVGRLTVDAINNRDYPIIQGVLIIFSGAYVLINLCVDLAYTLLDPQIRY